MARPVTIFTGQWADLPFTALCEKMASFGYDGLEIASWGDHLDLGKAAKDRVYTEEKRETLARHNLGCWAIGTHIIGQCVGDAPDMRNNTFAPKKYADKPEEIRRWAVDEMLQAPAAAANMGVKIVTGFMGSPIWKYIYSFPPTTEAMVEEGFQKIVELWSPIFDEFDRRGVLFALEVHPAEIAFDLYTAKRLLDAFGNRKTLGLQWARVLTPSSCRTMAGGSSTAPPLPSLPCHAWYMQWATTLKCGSTAVSGLGKMYCAPWP